MASIKISELRPAGSELFQDSESFLRDLGAQEMANTVGASLTDNLTLTGVTNTLTGNLTINITSTGIGGATATASNAGIIIYTKG
ncbi:hypothetical protein [Nostoc sp.]|uniref:hypothetical protein n=1 Tax=Nostoc sp. TaxID=1180 RepID=UPI002FFD0B26